MGFKRFPDFIFDFHKIFDDDGEPDYSESFELLFN